MGFSFSTPAAVLASASDVVGHNNDDDDDDDNVCSAVVVVVRCDCGRFIAANARAGVAAHVTSSSGSSSSTTTTSEHAEQDIRFFVCILHLRNIRAFMAFPQLIANRTKVWSVVIWVFEFEFIFFLFKRKFQKNLSHPPKKKN